MIIAYHYGAVAQMVEHRTCQNSLMQNILQRKIQVQTLFLSPLIRVSGVQISSASPKA